MIQQQQCTSVKPVVFEEVLRRIEKDGFIMKNKHGIYARFTNMEERAKPENQDVFSTPFVGRVQGDDHYIRTEILYYYASKKAKEVCINE